MKITLDKKYKTVCGLEVELYSVAVDNGGVYPVHGAILSRGGFLLWTCWTINGKQPGHGDRYDLVENIPY